MTYFAGINDAGSNLKSALAQGGNKIRDLLNAAVGARKKDDRMSFDMGYDFAAVAATASWDRAFGVRDPYMAYED